MRNRIPKDTPIFKDREALAFLERYITTPSPSGHEEKAQGVWMDYVAPFVDDFVTDAYGTVAGVINPGAPYRLMLEAHVDEVAWAVSNIASGGILWLTKIGGADALAAPSKLATIHTQGGPVKGVFGLAAIHVREAEASTTKKMADNTYIDIGVGTEKEAREMGIRVGDPVTFDDGLVPIGKNRFVARAADDKIGGFILTQVAKILSKQPPTCAVYLVNSVQEEVGKNGATAMSRTVAPHAAISVDVSHDTSTPGVPSKVEGIRKIGSGPVLMVAPQVNKPLLAFLEKVAEGEGVECQRKVNGRTTGTNADAVAFSSTGVPTALISIPLRYMHTSVEMFHTGDVRDIVRVLAAATLAIGEGRDFSPVPRRPGRRVV